ncbi:MAG: hypothetical protein GKR94_13970 [Gammaproteobacteria bacterium]|nr:hypothetical protein [Gammaproteobacteria bacterium]
MRFNRANRCSDALSGPSLRWDWGGARTTRILRVRIEATPSALLCLPGEQRFSGLLYDGRRERSPRGDGAGSPIGTGLLAKCLSGVHRHRPPQPSHRNSQPTARTFDDGRWPVRM